MLKCVTYVLFLFLVVFFFLFFFFFQAEDGIRDLIVTGVQTCALPILVLSSFFVMSPLSPANVSRSIRLTDQTSLIIDNMLAESADWPTQWPDRVTPRSEERRVGKECRSRLCEDE